MWLILWSELNFTSHIILMQHLYLLFILPMTLTLPWTTKRKTNKRNFCRARQLVRAVFSCTRRARKRKALPRDAVDDDKISCFISIHLHALYNFIQGKKFYTRLLLQQKVLLSSGDDSNVASLVHSPSCLRVGSGSTGRRGKKRLTSRA